MSVGALIGVVTSIIMALAEFLKGNTIGVFRVAGIIVGWSSYIGFFLGIVIPLMAIVTDTNRAEKLWALTMLCSFGISAFLTTMIFSAVLSGSLP